MSVVPVWAIVEPPIREISIKLSLRPLTSPDSSAPIHCPNKLSAYMLSASVNGEALMEIMLSKQCVNASMAVYLVELSESESVYFGSSNATRGKVSSPPNERFDRILCHVITEYWVTSLPVPDVVGIAAIGNTPFLYP